MKMSIILLLLGLGGMYSGWMEDKLEYCLKVILLCVWYIIFGLALLFVYYAVILYYSMT